ncbi:SLC13 family permease [Persephonella sp.]
MKEFLKREFLFFIFLFLFVLLALIERPSVERIVTSIDFPTIRALAGLMLITVAMKQSGFFDRMVHRFISRAGTERRLAFAVVFSAVFLSMFLTNDITLFVLLPIFHALKKYIQNDLTDILIFTAIGVNAGSALTPVGNPQNIFLYRHWDVGFFQFVMDMFPVFSVMFVFLVVFIVFSIPARKVEHILPPEMPGVNRFLFFSSVFLFVLFVVAMEMHLLRYLLPVIAVFYLIVATSVYREFDYFLIITFILMFIDFSMLASLSPVLNFFSLVDVGSDVQMFGLSVVLSQIMSNVPAAILMSHFSTDHLAIAYGVNIGSSGLVIASLANLIAIRGYGGKGVYSRFHRYSIVYLIVTSGIILVYLLAV